MSLLGVASLASTIWGGLKSLFSEKQDPYADIRKQMRMYLDQIKAEFPEIRKSLETQEAKQREALIRRQTDMGALLGLPRNVTEQKVQDVSLESMRNLQEALGRLDQTKISTLMNMARLTGSLPPKPVDISGQTLLGLGLQGLTATKANELGWLAKLLGLRKKNNVNEYNPELFLKNWYPW